MVIYDLVNLYNNFKTDLEKLKISTIITKYKNCFIYNNL